MAEKAAKKPNIFVRIGRAIVRFFRDTRGEMKKVVWPSAKQVRNNFVVVAVFVLVAAVFIFALDIFFNWVLGLLFSISPGAAEAVSSIPPVA